MTPKPFDVLKNRYEKKTTYLVDKVENGLVTFLVEVAPTGRLVERVLGLDYVKEGLRIGTFTKI